MSDIPKMIPRGQKLIDWCNNNGERGKRLLKEWTGIDANNNPIDIKNVTYGMTTQVYWKCSNDGCDKVWIKSIHYRTSGGLNCPACAGQTVSSINSLKSWCENNGDWGKQLLSEWNYKLNNELGYTPENVAKSSNKNVYWTCEKEHTWIATVGNRSGGKTSCPTCVAASTSYPEQFIYWSLKQLYPRTENRCRVLKSPKNPAGIEFDIGVPDIPLCIEYSPLYWHKGREEKDQYKKKICSKHKVRFIQIIEGLPKDYEEIFTENYIQFDMNVNNRDNDLIRIVGFILNSLGHSIAELDIELVKKNAWEYSHGKLDYEKSIAYTHPELAKEFHSTLNGDKTPENVSYGSRIKIYWQCTKCNYGSNGEWESVPLGRTIEGRETGCPCCGYNWHDGEYHQLINQTVIKGHNDLLTLYPELAKEWHPTLNDTTPDNTKVGSNIDRYWQCTKCGYGADGEWYVRPASRCNNYQKSGCPMCRYNWFDGKIHNSTRANAKIGVNDLATVYPELAKEIHPTLNEKSANEITASSHNKVYWKCIKCDYGSDGEWFAAPNRRMQKDYETGCPNCKYFWLIKDYKKNKKSIPTEGVDDLNTLYPGLAKEWHPTLNKVSAKQVKKYSRSRWYWQCNYCNYGANGEWCTRIYYRLHRNSGCPQCGYNWYKDQEGLPQKMRGIYR